LREWNRPDIGGEAMNDIPLAVCRGGADDAIQDTGGVDRVELNVCLPKSATSVDRQSPS